MLDVIIPPHVGPQQALVLEPQMSLWPHTPRATINPFFGFLCSNVGVDPWLQRGASNLPGLEEHFRDAIQAPS